MLKPCPWCPIPYEVEPPIEWPDNVVTTFRMVSEAKYKALQARCDALAEALRKCQKNDKTYYKHHEARPYDGALPQENYGTCWLTPREIARQALEANGYGKKEEPHGN